MAIFDISIVTPYSLVPLNTRLYYPYLKLYAKTSFRAVLKIENFWDVSCTDKWFILQNFGLFTA